MNPMPKVGVKWSRNEKPEVNHWYKVIEEDDYRKIVKDFYSKERNITFYRIVELKTLELKGENVASMLRNDIKVAKDIVDIMF